MNDTLLLRGLPVWANAIVVVGTILIIALGAAWVVESASRIAKRLGISELIIGLTVIAFGTSAPEFAVTIIAAARGQGDISVGNIVGSNIFNLGFILGGCALVRAIPTSKILLKRDGSVLAVITLVLFAMVGWDLRLDWYDGALLFASLLVYLGYLFNQRKAGVLPDDDDDGPVEESKSVARDGLRLLGGLVFVVGGSHLLVDAATVIARTYGVSDWVIAVTVVAAGTSAPEFATSLVAVLKGKYAISAGNVIGSDIFNLLGVLGVAGLLGGMQVDPAARASLAALSGMVFVTLLFMRTGWRLSRLEGLALILIGTARWGMDFANRAAP
jgi:cation:H+ antiporter